MRRVLIPNRGEIAVRLVRACRDAGLETVVGCSDADRDGPAARLADGRICLGPAPASGSYLRDDVVVQAALGTGCDAIHPGYGFLAESPRLARRAQEHGVRFVGPPARVIELAGDKLRAREEAAAAGLPVLPGAVVQTAAAGRAAADQIGYPVLLKAAGGGGGRGIKLVRDHFELAQKLPLARSEALAAFGDDRIYLERLVVAARHVEVQVAAGADGEVVHLGERDCSVQRRHQKLVEEAPAPELSDVTREAIRDAGVRFARAIGYRNLGTVEFVVDADSEEFYFLEMNCRIQVEHPVSEAVTGRDLVALQLRVADGDQLGFAQADVRFEGHAIECRLCAEDPTNGFQPSPGTLTAFSVPALDGLRVDTHCAPGVTIPPYYDSLMAKLIAHADRREHAIELLLEALEETEVEGVHSNRELLASVLQRTDFQAGAVTTGWLERAIAAAGSGTL